MSAMPDDWDEFSSPRPLTVRDLESMPDDGQRYELLDGVLLVSPASEYRHQKMALRMYRALEDACPEKFDVLAAPFAVQPTDSTELQPDVLVALTEDFTDKNLPVAPALAVEVLSPSTAVNDLNTKKTAYERLRVPSYWVLDPVTVRLLVFELDTEGRYQQVADVQGDDIFTAVHPFPVQIVPNRLLGRLVAN